MFAGDQHSTVLLPFQLPLKQSKPLANMNRLLNETFKSAHSNRISTKE